MLEVCDLEQGMENKQNIKLDVFSDGTSESYMHLFMCIYTPIYTVQIYIYSCNIYIYEHIPVSIQLNLNFNIQLKYYIQ